MVLTAIDFLNGLFSLIFVSVTIIVGLKIALKYFEIKQRIFLYIGLGWAGICSAWYPSSTSFLLYLITGSILEPVPYFFIGNVILHLSGTLFVMGVTEMVYKERQKIIVGIFVVIGIVYNIYFYYLLFTTPEAIGIVELFNSTYYGIVRYYLIFLIAVLYISVLLLARQSLKSNEPEIKWRGRLIIPALTCYLVGAISMLLLLRQ